MKNLEIERKFLVKRDKWDKVARPEGIRYIQGYLSIDDEKVIRVRIAGNKGFLTIKGRSETIARPEFEYEIPEEDAVFMIDRYTKGIIEKTRYTLEFHGNFWEVDEFHGLNEGLILAEIELITPDWQFDLPEWIGEEVTGDHRYYNSFLSENPFKEWENGW